MAESIPVANISVDMNPIRTSPKLVTLVVSQLTPRRSDLFKLISGS